MAGAICRWAYLHQPDGAAVSGCLAGWRATGPVGGALALAAERSMETVAAVQRACAEANLPLVGAVYPELVVDGEFKTEGVLLFGLADMPPHVLVDGLEAGETAGRAGIDALADFVDRHADPNGGDTLFMAFDCLVPNIGSLIDGLYAEVGDMVHFAGANAGSESFRPMPCLFDAERIRGDAVLAVLLADHPGAVLEHGYRLRGQPILASSTHGNRIDRIAGQPAFEQYCALARSQQGAEVARDNFYQMGVHFPFGLVRMDGDILVRIPVALGDDNSIFCVGEIPENGLLAVVGAVEPGNMETVRRVARGLDERGSSGALFFYCAGRRMHLQETARSELSALQKQSPYPVLGALSLGEIGNARQGGYPLLHNAALVGLPWPALARERT